MKERTLLILQALVEDFIETANPVASQKLLESREFKVSSATIRNEFASLEEVGLIHSPHVSSGKVPTEKGYRFFVNEFVNQSTNIDENLAKSFDKYILDYKIQKSKESLFDVMRLIAQLSSNVAFASIENDQTFYLGLSNVLRSPEFSTNPEQAAQIVEVLEGRERFKKLLSEFEIKNGETKIFIGEENLLSEISSCAMVVGRFEVNSIKGHIGILGPMRMKYSYNKTLVQKGLEMLV